jgi:hypothetical protein
MVHSVYVQVLTNGLEVKLQRNALSVLEPPTGLEEDDDEGSDHFSSRSNTGFQLQIHYCHANGILKFIKF